MKNMAEIVDKIPIEDKRVTASMVFSGTAVGLMVRLGSVVGADKLEEILTGMWSGAGKRSHPNIQEKYNITVEDAAGAAKLSYVVGCTSLGPEYKSEIVEANPKKAVRKTTKCPWMERYTAYNIAPEFRVCATPCAKYVEEGLKVVNREITFKLRKAMPRGDPYCEFVYEF
jgi:hypothetical protein